MANRKSTNFRSNFPQPTLLRKARNQSEICQKCDLSQAQNAEVQSEHKPNDSTRNKTRKFQTRKQINSRNKCDLRVLIVVTKESIIKLKDWLLGLKVRL